MPLSRGQLASDVTVLRGRRCLSDIYSSQEESLLIRRLQFLQGDSTSEMFLQFLQGEQKQVLAPISGDKCTKGAINQHNTVEQ